MSEPLTNIERDVLLAIAEQYPEHREAIEQQLFTAVVVDRNNTGAGFYITFNVEGGPLLRDVCAPLGAVQVGILGLKRGLAFLLWPEDGRLGVLEAHVWGDELTVAIDLRTVKYSSVRPEWAPMAH